MNILESLKPKIGVVLVSELLGTSLLVTTFLMTATLDVLTNAVMFFICILLTYTTSYAQLNPAVTLALVIKEGNYKANSFVVGAIVSAQVVGAFLGLELTLLLRVVYNGGQSIYPPLYESLPGIQSVVGDTQWLTVVLIDGFGCMLFTVFYLQTLEHKGDFVHAAFVLSVVYYASVWLVYQTTTSLFNPAVAVAVGFNNLWNFVLMGSGADLLWDWFWIAWIVGPCIGAAIAVPIVQTYTSQLIK